jgi:hypothetical protein
VIRVLAGEGGIVLEVPDQKARDFSVLIMLNWLFSEHVYKMLGKIFVRT